MLPDIFPLRFRGVDVPGWVVLVLVIMASGYELFSLQSESPSRRQAYLTCVDTDMMARRLIGPVFTRTQGELLSGFPLIVTN